MTMANPCPCEVIVNDSLSNDSPNFIPESTLNQLINYELLEEYLDHLTASQSGTSTDSDPFFRQTKSLDTTRGRVKRPSWAAVGKRAASLRNKRPSWAQVG